MKLKNYISVVIVVAIIATVISGFGLQAFGENIVSMDITNNSEKTFDLNYTITENEGTTTGASKVKLTWNITDIEVNRTKSQIWDTEELKWVDGESSDLINDGSATFTFENYSSVKVAASVSFNVVTGFNPTVVYNVENGSIILDTANGNTSYNKNTPPKGKIVVTVKPKADDFDGKTATSATKYGTYSVSIGKTLPTVVAPQGISEYYCFGEQNLVVPGSTNAGTLKYAVMSNSLPADEDYSASIPTATNPGEYTIFYKVFGDDFCESTIVNSVDSIISKLPVEVTNPTANSLTYNGNEQALVTEGSTNHGTMKYFLGDSEPEDDEYTTSIPTATDAGTYTVWFKSFGDDIYVDSDADCVEVTIDQTSEPTCLATGTKITMADGSLKNIEDIKEGEEVLTFNHETGALEAQKVYLAYVGDFTKRAFTLHFENGTTLSIVGLHDLFEQESMQYVPVTENNATDFVGKHFYNTELGQFVKLTEVTYETKETSFYSLYTEYNGNCIANGMLTLPDDIDEFFNIFEFNSDLTINQEQLEKDIAEFGIYDYPVDAFYSKEIYDIQNIKYINILVGKGFGTMDEFRARLADYLTNY